MYSLSTTENGATTPLSNDAYYTPWGALSQRNGMETWGYDNRMRQTSHAAVSGSLTEFSQSLGYDLSSNVTSSNEYVRSANSLWSYKYDDLNRLSTAVNASLKLGCLEGYDTWGNRTSQVAYGGTGYGCNSPAAFTASTNNQNPNLAYDAAGNTTRDIAGNIYTYDAEDRITSATSAGSTSYYTYRADGQRATKQTGSRTYYYSYDFDNNLVARYQSGQGITGVTLLTQEVWLNGAHLGTIDGLASGIARAAVDQIGSERVEMDGSGNIDSASYSLPFGDDLTTFMGTRYSPLYFTGKERDSESGLDYFGARYYANSMGRFLSPDSEVIPVPVPYGLLDNPQSLNLYSYVQNNPLTNTDPDGHSVNVCTTDSSGNQQCTLLRNDQYQAAQQGNGGLNVPTLDQVGTNGSGSITDSNGNSVGSATYVSDGGADYYGNQAGFNLLGTAGATVGSVKGVGAFYGASAAFGALGSLAIGEGGLATLGNLDLVPQIGSKLNYLLGQATGSAANVQRSLSMAAALSKIGLVDSPETRAYIAEKLSEAFSNPASVNAATGLRETLLAGPGGFVKLESAWQGAQLVTLFVKGGQ